MNGDTGRMDAAAGQRDAGAERQARVALSFRAGRWR